MPLDVPDRPALVAFDLDDTLAPSKAPLPDAVREALLRLLDVAQVCVISGGQIEQFRSQVVERLGDLPEGLAERLHLMPTCGTQYWRLDEGALHCVYADDLTEDEKDRAMAAVEQQAKALGLWAERTWGPAIEDRGSQITFSALGQQAPLDEKKAWDPTGEKKSRLRAAVQEQVPDLEVRSGGSTSVDITRKGIDKAYGMRRLGELTGVGFEDTLFVGDRLDPDGNDYPVKALGVPVIAVEGWEDTVAVIDGVVARF
ncbi:HAD-IIB family hydrolase [Amnibacterium endophyticum]|uniref:phosphomannomutase n=1 Tax=Amnibacterium endophyticum TaxID=2109337 RepID=A0ABW4LB61_9MICO